jgi:hypothetical protein
MVQKEFNRHVDIYQIQALLSAIVTGNGHRPRSARSYRGPLSR